MYLIRKMIKTAPTQMIPRHATNAAMYDRRKLLSGASVRALSIASIATPASKATTASVERNVA